MHATTRQVAMGLFVAAGLLAAPLARAHGHGDHDDDDDAKPAVAIRGELVDVACYVAGGERGEKHAACARSCAENNLPIGLLDAKGHVFLIIDKDHKPMNATLAPRMGQTVTAHGVVSKRGGIALLEVQKID